MGNVLAPIIIPLVVLGVSAILRAFRPPNTENPTLSDIQARHQAEEALRQAEQAAREAQEYADRIQREAELERERARERQAEADRAAAQAVEQAERMRAQIEESRNSARHARKLAKEASRAAREDAERLAREAREECERAQRAREDAEKAMRAAKEKAERAQIVADEQRREAEAARAQADKVARAAVEETRKAMEARKEAERRLKEGIQPVVTPSPEEVAATKQRIQYKDDCFHFAIAGISGSGKSSLVNAFRGLHNQDMGAAAVGVTETTLHMTRYPDANPENPFVWYDIPGAGTLKCRDWQYFNKQGLYVFDCIIVLFDNRFTMTDVAILLNARRFNIPTYIVRSKADQHIRNMMKDMGYDSDEEGDAKHRNKLNKAAHKAFIDETRGSVRTNLEDANLPDQRVYIISSSAMLQVARNKVPTKAIDEVELVNDLLNQAYSRRVTQSNQIASGSGSRK